MSGDSGINEDMLNLIQEINNGNFNSTIFENQPLENDSFNVLPGFTISDDFDLGIGMDPIHSQSLEDMLKPGLHTVASDIGSGLHTVDLSTVDELTPSSSSQSSKSQIENNFYSSTNSGIEASDLGSLLEQFEEVSNSASSTGSAMTPKKDGTNMKDAGSVYMFKSIAAPKSLLSTMSLPASPVSTPPSTPPPEIINKIKASNKQKSAILIPAVTASNKSGKAALMELHKSQSQPELKLSIQSSHKPKVMQSTPKTEVPLSNPKTEVPLSKSLAPLGLETKKKSIMLEVLTWDKEKNPAPLSNRDFQNKDKKDKISINLMCNGKDKKSLTNILEQNGKSQKLNRNLSIEKETKKRASPITLEEYKERRRGRLDGRGSGSCSPITTEVKRTSSPSLPNVVLPAIPDQILVDHGYSTIQPSPKMIKQVSEEVEENIDNKDAQPDAAIIKQLSEHIGGMIEVAFNTKPEASESFGAPPDGQSSTGSDSSSRDDTSSAVDDQPDDEHMDITEELASSTLVKPELQGDEPMNVMEEEPSENLEENIVEFEVHDSSEPETVEIQQLSEDVSIIVETDTVNDTHVDETPQVDVSSGHVEIKTEEIDLQTDIVDNRIDTETVSDETTIPANDAVSEVNDTVRNSECNELENNNKTTLEETMNSENIRYSKFKNEKSSSSKECLRGRSHRGRGQKRAYRKRDTSPGSDNDVYFDKIPQYFTALTKPEKPPKKTSDIKLTSMYHDDIDRDRSPIREDDTFDKVPGYYSCFTNSTKYDSTGPMTIHDVNRQVTSAVSSRSNSPLVIDSRAVSRANSRASSRSSSRSSSSSSGSCSSCCRGSSYSRSRSRSHSRKSRSSRRYHSRSRSRDRNRRSKRNRRSYRSRSRSHISRSHRSRSRSYRSRSRRSRSHRSRSRSYRSRSRSYRSRSRSYSPGRRYKSKRENRYNIPDRSRNGRPLDEQRDKHLKIEERRIVYVGRIGSNCVPKDLERRFERFGPIDKVTVHFRENGDNYGFVTFTYSCDAYACVEKGNDIPGERKYDLCFGGRREFCKTDYLDLDSKAEEEEWYGPQEPKQSASLDFDALLKQTMSKLKKKKS
ncbi:unnamed protein product [Owenia fusiformis]|uniref:RRM domain-containing protein n=1 Tax=Owenia fusiformis TaxID=6347 RepID=A0A8S4NU55_OWEFU|nr:unnamed protein product [Owenia fusiformis]